MGLGMPAIGFGAPAKGLGSWGGGMVGMTSWARGAAVGGRVGGGGGPAQLWLFSGSKRGTAYKSRCGRHKGIAVVAMRSILILHIRNGLHC